LLTKQDEENKDNNVASDDEVPEIIKVKGVKEDVRCMKETLRNNEVTNEFYDFHEKVNTILEK